MDDPDYDYEAWQKAGSPQDEATGHLPDTYKLPNHPTFSDESIHHGRDGNQGGHWSQQEDGSWDFAPGATNLQNHSREELQDYFNRVEPGNRIHFPSREESDGTIGRALRGYEVMPRSTHVEDRTVSPRSMVHALHNLPPMMLLDMMLPR